MTPSQHEAPLRAFVDDFDRRVSRLGWWRDAVLVAVTVPSAEEGFVMMHRRTYLLGSTVEATVDPEVIPDSFAAAHMSGAVTWARALTSEGLVNQDLFAEALATRAPAPDGPKNLLMVHVQRQPGNRVGIGYQWVHSPQVAQVGDLPQMQEMLDDVGWVREQVTAHVPGGMGLPRL